MRKLPLIALLLTSTAFAVGTVTGGVAVVKKGASVFALGQPGQPIMGVRNDADSVITGTNLTYGPIAIDSTGKVKVVATLSATITSSVVTLPETAISPAGVTANATSVYKMVAGRGADSVIRPFQVDSSQRLNVTDAAANASLTALGVTATATQASVVGLALSTTAVATLAELATQRALMVTSNASQASIDGKLPASLTVTGTRLLVDPSGVTSPVSATSLPLPLNAAVESKQPLLGTAGTASNSVLTIQGIASMTPVKTDQPTVASVTVSRASNAVASATLVANNASRKGLIIHNDSTTNCYYKFGATASATSYSIKLYSTDTFLMESPIYTGVVDFICDAVTGNTEATEQ